MSQPCVSPAHSAAPGRRSNPSAAGRSVGGSVGPHNIATGSTGCSADSQLGPLPSHAMQCLPDNPDETDEFQHGRGADAGGVALLPPPGVTAPKHGGSPTDPSSAHSANSMQAQVLLLSTNAGGTNTGSNHLGVSRASSHTSGVTTTSRPSRWGVLANILSAGLRSFTQIAHIVEPNTGNLTVETVTDLTRRASRLDMIRAVGQVSDLSLVGSGSMGLVYRGRIAEGGAAVCVKYLVARGADGMAAMATEGLLSRALSHPNIIVTHGWHVTRITSDNFLDLSEALAAMAARDKRQAKKQSRRARPAGKARRGGKRPAAVTGGPGCAAPAGASVPLPHLGGSMGGAGSERWAPAAGNRRRSCDFNSNGFTSNVLDLVRGAGAAGPVVKGRPVSPHGSPLSRLGSIHGSFTLTRRGPQTEAVASLMPTRLSAGPHHRNPHAVAGPVQPAAQPAALPAPPADGARTHFEGSWSVRRGELYGLSDAASSLLQQAAACDAAAAASSSSGPNGGATVTSNTLFTRESLSSPWFGPSPNPSNHRRSAQDAFARSALGDGSSHHNAGGFAAYGAGPALAAAGHGAGLPAPLQPSAPVSINLPAGRGRGMLARAGSRLQIATTPNTQPSIPEDMQQAGAGDEEPGSSVQGDASPISFVHEVQAQCQAQCRAHGAAAAAAAGAQTDEGRRLLRGMLGSGDVGHRASAASGSGRHAVVASVALGGSVGGSSVGEGSTVLSIGSLRLQPAPFSTERARRSQHEGSSGRPHMGLLAAALAAQGHASPGGLPPLALLHGSQYTPTVSRSISRSISTALALTRTTTSSKRFSSAATVPPLVVHSMPPVAGAAGGNPSVILSTPSGHGSGPAVASVADASAAAAGACGSGTGSGCAGSGGTAPATSPEAEAARQEALERGWRTLQHILHRLSARPGDYLTRIVMEDADRGSLLNAVRGGRFDVMNNEDALQALLLTALDIAHGMAFLHSHNVIHGDLKPSNVLLRSDPADPRGFVVKVSDFGLSRIISRDNDSVHNPEVFPAGTVAYMAPETVNGSSFKASDVWSYGVVLWQLVTGEAAPWPGLRNVQIMMGVMQGDLRLTVPPSTYPPLAHLVESCLARDHAQRPSFSDIALILEAMLRDLSRQPASGDSGGNPVGASLVCQGLSAAADGGSSNAGSLGAAGLAVPREASRGGPPLVASVMSSIAAPVAGTASPSLAPSTADEAGDELPRTGSGATSGARELELMPPGLMARPSFGMTSASLTAPGPSSNQLVHMSSSWANTTDRDPRSSAWQSSTLHMTTTANHFGGFGASSLGASAGVSTSTGTMMLERQCLQELFSRQRSSEEDSPVAEDGPNAGQTGSTGRHLGIYNPFTAAFMIGGSAASSGAAARTPVGSLMGGGGHGHAHMHGHGHGHGPAYAEPPYHALPIVHEEHVSSSACPTSQGSRASSMAPQAFSLDRRRRGSTGAAYGPGEGSLPGMLQQGLLVLGSRERETRSSKSTSASHRAGSAASSNMEAGSGQRPEDSASHASHHRSSGRNATGSGPFDTGLSDFLRKSSGPLGAASPTPHGR